MFRASQNGSMHLRRKSERRRPLFESLEPRRLLAGDISLVRYFDTWEAGTDDGGLIGSPDPGGMAYHAPSGHLFVSDPNANETPDIDYNGENIFEISLAGDQVFRKIVSNNSEPTGITYNVFDGFFYVTNDSTRHLARYDYDLNSPLAATDTRDAVPDASDPEDVTSDPQTGFLYVADGGGGGTQVLAYDSDLAFQYSFSVASLVDDPQGIAFHPTVRTLFVSSRDHRIVEYTLDGTFVEVYDLSGFSPGPKREYGLEFAPTSDPNDDPAALSLYIADRGSNNYPDGRIFEASINPAQPAQSRIIDDGDAGYSRSGTWTDWSGEGYQDDLDFAASGDGSSIARWTFGDLAAGRYEVAATWVEHTNRATDAPYSVYDGTTLLATVDVNQELAPDDFQDSGANWERLGSFDITGSTLEVRLTNDANEYVIADAVRIAWVESAGPEITVVGIADGDTTPSAEEGTDFGTVVEGETGPTRTYTVRNDGTDTLTLGNVSVPSGYTLTEPLSNSLASGESDTFTVRLDTDTVGTKTGEVSFSNNDSDENPFNFTVTGVVQSVAPEILEVRVAASSDDAEERLSSNKMYLTSTDLDMIADKGRDQIVGMRFNGLTIPAGATIQGAYLQFQADEVNSEETSLVIQGEATDHAATFPETYGDLSARPRTISEVPWTPPPWTAKGDAGPDQQTPDISSVIQEIVNRPGWAEGNSLAILVTGSGARVADSYDGDADGAPLLHVEYFTGESANSAPIVSAGDDQTLALSSPTVASLDGTVSDDGQPDPPGALSTQWTMDSGPEAVTFEDASAVDTTVELPAEGTYVLRLTADDEELTSSDDVSIAVVEGLPETLEVRVAASSDDAEERLSSNKMYLTSSDLDMIADKDRDQIVGMRFNGLTIPAGATIGSAYLQFQADEVNSEEASLVIQGEATDHAATFPETYGDLSARPRTVSEVPWTPPPWTAKRDAGPEQQTPDISTVIQEIVNRPGWAEGNSLAIIITGSGVRVADSYDGDADGAPLLHVEYFTSDAQPMAESGEPLLVESTSADGDEQTESTQYGFYSLGTFDGSYSSNSISKQTDDGSRSTSRAKSVQAIDALYYELGS